MARSLAAKASIAAKVDFYKGDFIGDKLLADMEARVAEVKEKYPEPPRRASSPQGQPRAPQRPVKRGKIYKSR